jgi:hypothetical protein
MKKSAYQVIDTEAGRKFMCPQCNTWALVDEAQYHGRAQMSCPHPRCDWSGTVDLAADQVLLPVPAPETRDSF